MAFEDVLAVALEAARSGAAVHQKHVGRVQQTQWTSKGTADFVSFVDHEAESRILDIIMHAFPTHEVMAEEASTAAGPDMPGRDWASVDWLWIVDPLDGTTNFLHAYPMYCTSVGVAHRGELVAGAVVCGPTGEEWTATAGGGARLNGDTIRVSEITELRSALIGTGFPFKILELLPRYLREFEAVTRHTSGARRAGSAALDLCHVATGYFDGFWELDLYPWDIAAGSLMIREAGGIVTAMDGPLNPFERCSVLAGNPAIHEALGRLLEEVDR